MARTKSEAEVTATKNQGSGAITDPNQAANPPAEAPQPATDAEANPDKDGLRAADRLYANDRLEADYDYDVMQDVDPREDRQPEDANQQDLAEEGESAIDRMLRIKYRGKEEDVSEEDAVTMIQQFKMMDNKYGPILQLARNLSEQTGESDPQKLAEIMAGSIGQAVENRVNEMQPEAAAMQQPEQPDPALMQRQQQDLETSRQQAQAFFDDNGLTPTNEAMHSMTNMIMYGDQISRVANTLPQLMADVEAFKQSQAMNAQESQRKLVDSTASAVAAELGIDTEQEFNDYLSWVDGQEEFIPNYKQVISQNPKAMERSIRDYHAIATGNRNTQEQMAMKKQVEKNIQRAGGETVASRGSDAPGGPAPANFNDEIMNLI
ncbi:MAG: hypothetical protein Unbinned1190contig1000_43 [Prokaryotic dsDNA virus sp.]|nr:MAG: hypothetical protein Unbinned1190contig1000_43 [Prokaryotic dsDNA virus sp.]|tara:strand:- start:6317 stop:7450 length:1134 start_codon:yes stop_codon:yes gene_type:complete